MSIIEQAAKRLEQLRQSGVEVSTGTEGSDVHRGAPGPATEPVPLRVVKELEARIDGVENSAETSAASQGRNGAEAPLAPAQSTDAPTTGTVPIVVPSSKLQVEINLADLSAKGYITPQAPRSQLAEQFRVIKRPLLTNARGKTGAPVSNANRIMVTSSLPAEGKTFVAVNLAMSLAMEIDTHVLLVDADTSRPAVLERLGLPRTKGLLDLLLDSTLPVDSVVMSTNIERLSILPAGNPHGQATELLASEAMSRLVERLASVDRRLIVLFDTPPLLAASEARVLAAHMGQVILVVAADDTPQGTVAEALSTVEHCPVVMTLLNRSTATDGHQYYGSYDAYAQ